MINCDQEHQERRRARRTIVEYSPKGSYQSNGVVEGAPYHMEGLLRTMHSDLMEKTGVNVYHLGGNDYGKSGCKFHFSN